MIDYLAQHLWQIWAVFAVAFLILELTAGDFFIICFSVGAAAAAITAAVGGNVYWQIALFCVSTLACLFWVRPVARRYLNKEGNVRVSNIDALLNREGKVVEMIEAGGYGRVQIDGDIWKARCTSDMEI